MNRTQYNSAIIELMTRMNQALGNIAVRDYIITYNDSETHYLFQIERISRSVFRQNIFGIVEVLEMPHLFVKPIASYEFCGDYKNARKHTGNGSYDLLYCANFSEYSAQEVLHRRFGAGLGRQAWQPSILLDNNPSGRGQRRPFLSAKCDRNGNVIINGSGEFHKADKVTVMEILRAIKETQDKKKLDEMRRASQNAAREAANSAITQCMIDNMLDQL